MTLYLDHNATTPLEPSVAEAVQRGLQLSPANPSSLHGPGRAARRALEDAREEVARTLSVEPDEIVFTGGATEANALAIGGLLLPDSRAEPLALAISAIEHPSVLWAAERLERAGRAVHRLAVDAAGRVNPAAIEEALETGCELVSVIAASNEIGTLQDLDALAAPCRVRGIPFHTDATQCLGKTAFKLDVPGVVAASLSAHKIGGPTGVGALWVHREQPLTPIVGGGGQERGRRAGTENLAGILGFAEACRLVREEGEARHRALERLEAAFLAGLRARGIAFVLHGASSPRRLPGTLSVRFPGIPGESLLFALDLEGVCVSLGSACSSGAARPSHVLAALGLPKAENLESIRISLGWRQRPEEMEEAATRIARVIARFSSETT